MNQQGLPEQGLVSVFVNLEKLMEKAHRVAKSENCILYDIQIAGPPSNPVLRVFIDKDLGKGISIEDCSRVSRGLDFILEKENLIHPDISYQLEVSSPGLDRHLKEQWHFEKVLGKRISVQTHGSGGKGGKKYTGQLIQANEEAIKLNLEDFEKETIEKKKKPGDKMIPYHLIKKARVVLDFSTNNKYKKEKNSNRRKRKG